MEVDIDQFFKEYRPMIQTQMGFQTDEQWQVCSPAINCYLWRQSISKCYPGLCVLLLMKPCQQQEPFPGLPLVTIVASAICSSSVCSDICFGCASYSSGSCAPGVLKLQVIWKQC